MANEMLADTTIAGQEGVIEYVANSAALQQFEQTSLAYLILRQHDTPLDVEGICSAIEQLLEQRFQASYKRKHTVILFVFAFSMDPQRNLQRWEGPECFSLSR